LEDKAYNDQFFAYISAGGDPKKFPKRREQTIQKSGTSGEDILRELKRAGINMPATRGTLEEYGKLRGLKKVRQLADGTFIDEAGSPVTPPKGHVFVPIPKRGE